jgi:DNA-binding MarR family transcriptional regulator
LLCDAAACYGAYLAEALAPLELTPAAGTLLRALWRLPRDGEAPDDPWWAQREAARRARLPAMDVSRLLAAFERSSLVERGPRVGRGRTVRLTNRGEELARRATEAAYAAERRLLRPLGDDRGGLRPFLRQLLRLER